MNPDTSDQISVTEMLQTIDAPVTITFNEQKNPGVLRWTVQIHRYFVNDRTLGMALFRCATAWRADKEQA